MTSPRLALLVSAFVAVSGVARAEDTNEARAEALFRSATSKFDAGQYAEACADFEVSLRLEPKLGTLLNLALCHETVGRSATAWGEWNHASAWAAQNGQRERHDYALQHVLALEARMPRIVFQLPLDRAFAAVEIDGEPVPVPRAYLPQYLDPGEHTIAVTAPGKKRSSTTFRVVGSATEQIVVVASLQDEAAPPLPPPPLPPARDRNATRRAVGWATLGVGTAGVIVGGMFGVVAIGSRDDAAAHCMGNLCDETGAAHYRDAQNQARVATIGIALGLAAVAGGTFLVLTSKDTRVAVSPAGVGGVF